MRKTIVGEKPTPIKVAFPIMTLVRTRTSASRGRPVSAERLRALRRERKCREWVSDWYRPDYYAELAATAKITRDPNGPATPFDPSEPGVKKRVHRGHSFLCTDQYCSRYMVGTRGKGDIRTGTNHLGFRLAKAL